MARRGVFGRSPRPAASLTNTIIAIAREMQNTRDNNIMSAWQKGGQFEGKQVTDDMVLKHWKTRSGQVDKSDPMYDTYQQAYDQLDYTIHESKMRTAYAQKKISNSQAAAFYLNWAKKVPKNSEFYRVLMRDAAGFTNAAKARVVDNSKQLAEEKYRKQQAGIYKTKTKIGESIFEVFRNLAIRGLLPGGKEELIDQNNGDIQNLDAAGVEVMMQLINGATDTDYGVDVVDGGKRAGGTNDGVTRDATDRVLYHDPITNKPVTGKSIIADLQAIDPTFPGVLTVDNVRSFIAKTKEGLLEAAELARKTGHYSDEAAYNKAAAATAEKGRQVDAWPVEQDYIESYNRLVKLYKDPNASQQDIIDETEAHRKRCAKWAQDPTVAANDIFINKLNAEAAGNAEASSLIEDWNGMSGAQPEQIGLSNDVYERAQNSVKLVESRAATWAQGEWDTATNTFVPSPGGSAIGPATPQQLLNAANGNPSHVIYQMDKGGRLVPTTMIAQEVNAHSYGPDGVEAKATGTSVLGYVLVDGKGQKTYLFKDGQGHELSSDQNPWGPMVEGDDGFSVNIPFPGEGVDLASKGFAAKRNARTGEYTYTYDPLIATFAAADDLEHLDSITNGSGDPHRDVRSPNLAYWGATLEGERMLETRLALDEGFQTQVDSESKRALGGKDQFDEKGNYIGVLGYDEKAFERTQNQTRGRLTGDDKWLADENAWNNDLDAGLLKPVRPEVTVNTPSFADNMWGTTGYDSFGNPKLATEQTQGTTFQPLGDYFGPNGKLIPGGPDTSRQDRGSVDIGFGIAGNQIRVPGYQPNYAAPAGAGNQYTTPAVAGVTSGGTTWTSPAGTTASQTGGGTPAGTGTNYGSSGRTERAGGV